jgi:predicted metal-dependent HD superfamily phosphohydrolase
MIAPERLAALQANWVQLVGGYGVGPAESYPVFDRLVAAYSEPHRHYHNLEHLSEMFRVARKLADFADDMSAVQLAIWFHDVVYDPKAKDNEERSASLAIELLQPLDVPEPVLVHVKAMILATAHVDADRVDADTAVLLDADLAILGAEERRYARYAADIRREYAWVPDDAYRAGRSKVLEGFLARPRIYRTERMHQTADATARDNLRKEIEHLLKSHPQAEA